MTQFQTPTPSEQNTQVTSPTGPSDTDTGIIAWLQANPDEITQFLDSNALNLVTATPGQPLLPTTHRTSTTVMATNQNHVKLPKKIVRKGINLAWIH